MNETVLSICTTCRDGDEENLKKRGQRLLENIVDYFDYKNPAYAGFFYGRYLCLST